MRFIGKLVLDVIRIYEYLPKSKYSPKVMWLFTAEQLAFTFASISSAAEVLICR